MEFSQSTINEENPISLKKYQNPMSWIFWRSELNCQFVSLLPEETLALQMAIDGSTFSNICEELCQFVNEEEVAIPAATFPLMIKLTSLVRRTI